VRARALVFGVILACGGAPPAKTESVTVPAASQSAAASSASATAPAASSSPAPSASAAASEPAPDDRPTAPVVTLLDPGAAPRSRLRYAFHTRHETMRMDLKMTMALGIGGAQTPSVSMPTIRMDLDIDPVGVDAEGTLTATSVVRRADVLADATLPPASAAKLAGDMKSLVGTRGRFVVTSRGVSKEATIDLPPNAPENIRQIMQSMRDSLRDLCAVLPEEPVGVGARWTVLTRVRSRAIAIEQTATYTLKRRAGNVADEDVALTQTAPPQVMHLPGKAAAAGTVVKLVSMNGVGRGHVHQVLDKLSPTSSLHSEHQMKMAATTSIGSQDIDMAMTLDLAVKPLP